MPKWFTSTHACADTPFNNSVGDGAGTTVYLETPLQSVLIESDPELKVVVINID